MMVCVCVCVYAGKQDLPGAGGAEGPGGHVGGDETQGVELPGEQQRDGHGPGRSAGRRPMSKGSPVC